MKYSFYKLTVIAFFWHSQTHRESVPGALFFSSLILIWLLDATKTDGIDGKGINDSLKHLARGLVAWSVWPFYLSLTALFLVFGSFDSLVKASGSDGSCSAYSACGGRSATTAAASSTGCQCQSKAGPPANARYIPAQTSQSPKAVPLKRNMNGSQPGPATARPLPQRPPAPSAPSAFPQMPKPVGDLPGTGQAPVNPSAAK